MHPLADAGVSRSPFRANGLPPGFGGPGSRPIKIGSTNRRSKE